ncbi:MAG: hypothetical protein LBT75_01710 [Bacilli bacterium]|nr:hypothetical protein [Bacilli bacterium]
MIKMENKLNLRRFTNKFLIGTCLSSYIVRTIIYSLVLFFIYSSFNDFYANNFYGDDLTLKYIYGHRLSFYFFNEYIGSYLLFVFIIESINLLFYAIHYKNQVLFYRIGRTNDFMKEYFKFIIKHAIYSTFIIFLACFICSVALIIINFIITKEIMIFDPEYYEIHIENIYIGDFIPAKYRLLASYIITSIPAFIGNIFLIIYCAFFYEKTKNIILQTIFTIFIYIISVNAISIAGMQYAIFLPVYPIINIKYVGPVWISYLSIGIQSIIVFLLFKYRKRMILDEI